MIASERRFKRVVVTVLGANTRRCDLSGCVFNAFGLIRLQRVGGGARDKFPKAARTKGAARWQGRTLARSPDARDTFLTRSACVVICAVKPAPRPFTVLLSFLIKKLLVDFAGVWQKTKEQEIPPAVIAAEIVRRAFGSYSRAGHADKSGRFAETGIAERETLIVDTLRVPVYLSGRMGLSDRDAIVRHRW